MISRTWFDRLNDFIFSMVELRVSLQPSDEIQKYDYLSCYHLNTSSNFGIVCSKGHLQYLRFSGKVHVVTLFYKHLLVFFLLVE